MSHVGAPEIKVQPTPSAVTILSQGALLKEFKIAGYNIVLGFPEAALYKSYNSAYFGETIGRTTNRVGDATIHNLNGRTYKLAKNDGSNSLHGGSKGWGKKLFKGPVSVSRDGRDSTYFSMISQDGDEGYPGTVECRIWYTARTEDQHVCLDIEYEVELIGNECDETVVGLTNHSYFNLNPNDSDVAETTVILATDKHLELNAEGIPTGHISKHFSVPSANAPFTLGSEGPSFDDCFVMDPTERVLLDNRTQPLRRLVSLYHHKTDLHLEVLSTEPAFQFYTGDGIDVPEHLTSDGQRTAPKGPRAGVAIEPSRYVDAQRHEWRQQCLLTKGELWGSRSQYRAWKGGSDVLW